MGYDLICMVTVLQASDFRFALSAFAFIYGDCLIVPIQTFACNIIFQRHNKLGVQKYISIQITL